MKSISLSFQIHQPFRFKKYRFFDIGNDSYYYDDYENERNIRLLSENYYLPSNELLISLLTKYKGRFKVAFSISGTAIDQFYLYAPEVIESFQQMADSGSVEFLCETYSHSLASLQNKNEFIRQVDRHGKRIEKLFDQIPRVFKNTELIYSDTVGETIAEMGFRAVLIEPPRRILRWRSPNFVYHHPYKPELSLLLKNSHLSENISLRLAHPGGQGISGVSNNYISILNHIPPEEKIVNIFMNYDLVGKGQKNITGVFNFLKSFPLTVFEMTDFQFLTPSEIVDLYPSVSEIQVPEPISGVDMEGRDLSSLLGNELQLEAMSKLYSINDKVENCTNGGLLKDWEYLQATDHFYYMCSKFFSHSTRQDDSIAFNPYNNPYEAFLNYMNILDDFIMRLNKSVRKNIRVFTYSRTREILKEKSI